MEKEKKFSHHGSYFKENEERARKYGVEKTDFERTKPVISYKIKPAVRRVFVCDVAEYF